MSTSPSNSCLNAFINEFHYRNDDGVGVNEFVEIAHKSDYSLVGHILYFYDGVTGFVYYSIDLGSPDADVVTTKGDDKGNGDFTFSVYYSSVDIRDGPDGIALLGPSPGGGVTTVLDFVSYGGSSIAAPIGPAYGAVPTEIEAEEPTWSVSSSTSSLQLQGTFPSGTLLWVVNDATPGFLNEYQRLNECVPTSAPTHSVTYVGGGPYMSRVLELLSLAVIFVFHFCAGIAAYLVQNLFQTEFRGF